MKKIFAILLALTMIFVLAGCRKDKQSDTQTTDDLIQKYVESFVESEEYKNLEYQAAEQGIDYDVVAKGKNIVYQYKYRVETTENAAELLEESMNASDNMMQISADSMRKEVDGLEYLIVEYYAKSGDLIIEFKF